MHRDICPANIVLGRDGAPCLVDFALATSVAEIRPGFTHHSEIVGTLAYLAPEQTGAPPGRWISGPTCTRWCDAVRAGHGGPPFGTGDPLRLTHDHLARVPVSSAG